MARLDKGTESARPKWRALWDRIPWARIGQIGSALGGIVAIGALVQAFTKEAPSQRQSCWPVGVATRVVSGAEQSRTV
jgi:hypothetical protein